MSLKTPRRYNKTPSRRKVQGVGAQTLRGRRTPIKPTFGIPSTTHVQVTFDQPVIYTGILPGWVGPTGQTVVSLVIDDPLNVTLAFSSAVAGGTDVTIPFEDPAFRNNAGGYVLAGDFATGDAP